MCDGGRQVFHGDKQVWDSTVRVCKMETDMLKQ